MPITVAKTSSVTAQFSNPQEIVISHLDDSIKVGDGNRFMALNADGSVPVTVVSLSSATATLSSIPSSATTVQLLPANNNRRGYIIFNDSTQVMYLAYAATSSKTAFTMKVMPQGHTTSDLNYRGAVSALWDSANGSAVITELT